MATYEIRPHAIPSVPELKKGNKYCLDCYGPLQEQYKLTLEDVADISSVSKDWLQGSEDKRSPLYCRVGRLDILGNWYIIGKV